MPKPALGAVLCAACNRIIFGISVKGHRIADSVYSAGGACGSCVDGAVLYGQ